MTSTRTDTRFRRRSPPRELEQPTYRRERRPPWRQRLVQTERGLANGLRFDSTLFVHFFTCSIVLAAAGVLGIGWMQWAILVLAINVVIAAELFNQLIKMILEIQRPALGDLVGKALGISTAAVMFTIIGAVTAIVLIFLERFQQLQG